MENNRLSLLTRGCRKAQRITKRIVDTCRYYSWKASEKGRASQRLLESLRGSRRGRRCFVMGNGPSLLKCDLALLDREVTICSNANYLIWDKMGFIPTFLTVEDRLVAEDRRNELNALDSIIKIFPYDLNYCLLQDDHTCFINFLRNYKNFPQFSDDFAKQVYWGGTVSAMNIQLAYYLGCSEIYLIGFDHQYKVPDKMQGTVITSESDDVNHIHPDYFGKGYRWHDPNVDRMEESYRVARSFLEPRGVVIKNATVGGNLNVFERISYQSLFN